MNKKGIDLLKIASYLGMGLSFIGTILSEYASSKQTDNTIRDQVNEAVKKAIEDSKIA